VDFLLVTVQRLNFLLGITAEALRANIDWKSAFLFVRGQRRWTHQRTNG